MFRALMTRMVNEYNGLLARLSQSGFNSDATEEAYERAGARDGAKDVALFLALFFFYLVVRDNDISFDTDEMDGTENESEGLTETTYARSKRKAKEKAEQEEEARN